MTTRTRLLARALTAALCAGVAVLVVGLPLLRMELLVEHSDSMAPALRVGDALLVRSVPAGEVLVGQVVTLESAEVASTTHRVVERTHRGGVVRLVTQGDANTGTEEWRLAADASAGVLVARMPLAGYVLHWLRLPGVRLSLVLALLAVLLPSSLPGRFAARRAVP